MSNATDTLRKATEDAATRIERLEAQLYRTKAYFVGYVVRNGGVSGTSEEIPGFANTASDIFHEVDQLLADK